MGDANQLQFVTDNLADFKPPYLEIGAKDYGNTQPLRSLFPESKYVGVDMSSGRGVDLTLDFTSDFEILDAALGQVRFASIFCLSVLEHCSNPFVMASNMTRLLADNGRIYISAPFAWKFHGYPSDYWRFTHEGVKQLFPELDWNHPANAWTTPASATTKPLNENLGRIKNKFMRLLTGHRYLLTPTMVDMIGTRRTQ